MSKIYYQGTQNDFDTWHTWAKDSAQANIPAEGIINKILEKEMPDSQRTVAYSVVNPHESRADDFIWVFGDYPKADMGLTEYTQQEGIDNAYLPQTPDDL